jgi:hypothetical protein
MAFLRVINVKGGGVEDKGTLVTFGNVVSVKIMGLNIQCG